MYFWGAEPCPHHFGFEGGLDLSVGQAFPVDASEERLLPDVPFPLGPTAQPLGRVLGHQLREIGKMSYFKSQEEVFYCA